MVGLTHRGRGGDGFTMVELLVTIVLAGIFFAAMVPLFANVLHATAGDALRNDAQIIAQDRIEQVRLLAYTNIDQSKLNNPPSPASEFGDGRFGTTYTLTGQSRPYIIGYTVEPQLNASGSTVAQKVSVSVRRPGGGFTTTMTTIVRNPAPGVVEVTTGGTSTPLPTTNLSITVSFKNWAHVIRSSTKGVFWTRVDAATGAIVTSPHTWPADASHPTVVFTGLTGGANYTYTVSCYSSQWSTTEPLVSPPFHLLKSARLKFDTNPGGS